MLSKSAELQYQISEIDRKIQEGVNLSARNQLEADRNKLNDQLQAALAEEENQQVRVQAQEEAVESITLPLDFNELLESTLANEMIIEVVKQFQRQAYEEHNAEVGRINAEWQNKIQEAIVIELDQKSRIIELQNELSLSGEEYDNLNNVLGQALIEKGDAEQKRDNAMRELTESNENFETTKELNHALAQNNADLQEQIEALKQELTAKKALTVNGSDKLSELANKAKESTIAKANRGLERWNEQYGLDIPVLAIPDLEPVTELEAPAMEPPFQPEEEVRATAFGLADQSLSLSGEESEVITLESLKAEVDAIKSHLGLVA
jgi:peptidyl-tRNA hydrolase